MSRKKERPAPLRLPPFATVGVHVRSHDDGHLVPITGWHECTVVRTNALGDTVLNGPNGMTCRSLCDMWVPSGNGKRETWKRVDQAAEHPNARGLWWWNKDGAPVRVATTLEVAFYRDGIVIASGWTLATPEGEEIPFPPGKLETEWRAPYACCSLEAPKEPKPRPVYKTVDDKRLAHAVAMLRAATTRRKRAETYEKKWAKEVKRLERRKAAT